jgi:DNA-binding transcriptional ArsR family regulator
MTTTVLSEDMPAGESGPGPLDGVVPLAEMAASARDASRFLKALSNRNRLLLLCLLSEGEKTVTELEAALGLRQPAISQQLARLRAEGLIAGRRDGKSIHYRLASDEARQVMMLLYELFCGPGADKTAQAPAQILEVEAAE